MKNFGYIIFFILFSFNIISAQTSKTDSVSTKQTKIETKYGSLTINKYTSAHISSLSIQSSLWTNEDCPLADYTVYVIFYIESDGSISKYEILRTGKIKCLEDAVDEFCKEILLKIKEKNIKWLFNTDSSQKIIKYRLPIKIHTE